MALEVAVRSRAELDFIRDRVKEYVRMHQPTEPLLTELYPEVSPPKTLTCKAGHTRTPGRKCPTCSDGPVNEWPTSRLEGEGY
jgi:hypothetical protein